MEKFTNQQIKGYLEILLRVIRAFSVFYLIALPVMYLDNLRLAFGSFLLCLSIFGLSYLGIRRLKKN